MKNILTFITISLISLFSNNLYSQCLTGTLYPSSTYTPTCSSSCSFQDITTLGYAGEYSNVNVISGNTYTFKASISTYYITISNSTGTVSYASGVGGAGGITWLSTVTGVVRFYTHTNASCGTASTYMTRSVCCVSPPPANDLCANATALPCGTTNLAGTTVSTTNVTDPTGCSNTSNYGVWYTFVGDGNQTTVSASGGSIDIGMAIVSGSCGSFSSTEVCVDDYYTTESYTFTTTNAVNYYVYIAYYGDASTTTGTFTISRTCITPTSTCTGNYYDSGGSGGSYSNSELTQETFCSDNGDCISLTFNSFALEDTYDYLYVYLGNDVSSSPYGAFTGSDLSGVTIESFTGCITLVFESDGVGTAAGWDFSVSCGTCPPIGPCGNPETNDYCSDPAILTQGGSGWSSSTTSIYNAYEANPLANPIFCGSIENNSWYQFTAQSTIETFNFSSVTNCADGGGVQAEVYSIGRDANGCCTSLSSVSNCMNPGLATPGIVTATGLTIGVDYILMVDGFAADNCDFTVSNWSATGILPVTLTNFTGYQYENGNKLIWTTKSEINNDYFILQKSFDGKHFEDVGIIDGNGNSSIENNYTFFDNNVRFKINYYRLKQIDFDGKYEYSKTIVISSNQHLEINLYPNPSKEDLYFDISESSDEILTVQYINVLGSLVSELISTTEGKNTYQVKEFRNLKAGIYLVQLINSNKEVIKYQKIVKK